MLSGTTLCPVSDSNEKERGIIDTHIDRERIQKEHVGKNLGLPTCNMRNTDPHIFTPKRSLWHTRS